MGFILVDKGESDYELIPETVYIATCILLADLGTVSESYKGEAPKDVEKLYIGWELNSSNKEGKPYVIGCTYGAYLGSKATLRKDLQSWRGRAFTEEELKGFDIRNILGKSCSIGIIHKSPASDPSKKYARVGSIQALPGGVTPYAPLTTPWIFDINEFSSEKFSALPRLAQDVLKRSYEYKAMVDSGVVKPQTEATHIPSESHESVDDIPF